MFFSLVYTDVMSYRTIQQSIPAASQFTGVAPAGALTVVNGIETYASNVLGGLFNFAQTKPTPVKYAGIKLGGQSSWTLKLLDGDDNVLGTVLSGTNEATKYSELTGLILMKGDKLKLETTGATTAMIARLTVATR